MAMENVLRHALERITPSKAEREEFLHVLNMIEKATDGVIKPHGLEKTIAGSFIRDTWLADKKEMDLFILFDVSFSRDKLEKIGLDVGKNIIKKLNGKYEIAYAEHPYVKGIVKGFSVDIVPCYKVESASKIISAVDRTPFHNKYILKKLRPKMSGEVRLAKQFCKSMDVYGSDIRTLGFSGYLCELLIIKYGTFKNLVKYAGKWKRGTFIDLESHCRFDIPLEQFKHQPLIVIDPTDPKRNVAASLSDENFMKFIGTCRQLIKKPANGFFEIKKIGLKKGELRTRMKKRNTEFFAAEFGRPKVVDDILWSQMRKTTLRITKLLKENGFDVSGYDVWGDEKYAFMFFEMKTWLLPERVKLTGPPIASEKHSEEFIKKYGRANVRKEMGKWTVKVKRKYRKANVLIADFLKKPEKTLVSEGVRSYIAKGIARGFSVLKTKDVEKTAAKNVELSVFLKKYFEKG